MNGNREKQAFILAKVRFVSNINGCEMVYYGFGFSIKVDVNPQNSKIRPKCVVKDPKQMRAGPVFLNLLQVGI
jgi:hypothetical protein